MSNQMSDVRTTNDAIRVITESIEENNEMALDELGGHIQDWMIDEESRQTLTNLIDLAVDLIEERLSR
jgi:hypothetical protein